MIFGKHDQQTLAQFADVAQRGVKAALMADGHLGYIMPIGGVVAYKNKVSVAGVGFDIGCGNAAIRTDLKLDEIAPDLERLADAIAQTVSFGLGRRNTADDAPTDHPLFDDPAWDALPNGVRAELKEKARAQLGTVGSGNHYVDVLADTEEQIWVAVHFGSRGLGHSIASGFMALAQGAEWGAKVPATEGLLDLDSPLGEAYWALMDLAGQYARIGREWVARKVVGLLGGRELELIHNHHNFAWKEVHGGEELVVVRKGATPAFPGQKGFVGGSMGDIAVILQGSDSQDPQVRAIQERALFSTVHGAGRIIGRRAAKGKVNRRGEVVEPGLVSLEAMRAALAEKGVILRGGGVDEAPQVYRRLRDVLDAQGPTVQVLTVLTPLIVVMAGANEVDPYKD